MDMLKRPLSRRSLLGGGLAAGVGVAAIALVGCGDDDTEAGAAGNPTATPSPAPTGTPPTGGGGSPEEKKLVRGWFRGEEVTYYDFGTASKLVGNAGVATAPIYVLIKGMKADGTPDFVTGQHNIVTVVPGDSGYSDLWQVNLVTVPGDYVADSVKSKAEIDSRGFKVTPTDMHVNCPIVPEGTTFEGGEPLVQGWKDGEAVFYPDFGPNVPAAIPIFAFITGMDGSGNPQFVDGQRNIIDAVPGDAGYSAFWLVNLVTVPQNYTANTLKSAADVRSMGLPVTVTDMVVNCPVVEA